MLYDNMDDNCWKSLKKLHPIKIGIIILTFIMMIGNASSATVAFSSSTPSVTKGQTFEMNINIDPQGAGISGAQLNLLFNRSMIRVNSIKEGNLFKQNGAGTFFNKGNISNTTGIVGKTFGIILGAKSISTTGTFIIINATAIGAKGTTGIALQNIIVGRPDGTPAPLSVVNGSIDIIEGTPQVGITNMKSGIFFDNFELNANYWISSGLWHITTKRSNSSSHSFWYGDESKANYNTGTSNYGYLNSTPISLPSAANIKFSFMSWYNTESDINYDKKIVQVSSDNGNTWVPLKQINDTKLTWNKETIDISNYAGKIIKIRFYFDTIDPVDNNYEGWYIDDVKIESDSTSTGGIIDLNPPAGISSLKNNSFSPAFINWNWIEPIDSDFSHVKIYINGIFITNVSKGTKYYNATGLNSGSSYTISTKTVDISGNINNIWINHTAKTANIPKVTATIFLDNFELSTNYWTASGLWHLTTKRSNSSSHSFWYGNESKANYDTGKSNYGYLNSTSISLPSTTNIKFSFMSWYNTEIDANYDKKIVQVSSDNGNTWVDLRQINDAKLTWNKETIDISNYAGKIIKIRFYFDTIDPVDNNYEGWYIDDVKIETVPTP